MAATVTRNPEQRMINGALIRRGTVNLGSYATGGLSVTKANLGFSRLDHVNFESKSGYVLDYNATTEMLLAYEAGGDEVDNMTNLAAIEFPYQGQGF